VLLENALLRKKGDHLIVFFFTYYFSKIAIFFNLFIGRHGEYLNIFNSAVPNFLCEPI